MIELHICGPVSRGGWIVVGAFCVDVMEIGLESIAWEEKLVGVVVATLQSIPGKTTLTAEGLTNAVLKTHWAPPFLFKKYTHKWEMHVKQVIANL